MKSCLGLIFVALISTVTRVTCQNASVPVSVTDASTEGATKHLCPSIYKNIYDFGGQNCCKETYETFITSYNYLEGIGFAFTMEKLRAWNCSEYWEQCKYRPLAFNQFSSLLYDRFCNFTLYESKCFDEIKALGNNVETSVAVKSPCLQVAAYQTGRKYAEVRRLSVAFCGTVWCGFDEKMMIDLDYSAWDCYPTSCQVSTIVIMAISGILAVVTTLANATILAVITRNPKFKGGHMKYRQSLAVADLLVGIFVFPSFIGTLYYNEIGPLSVLPDLVTSNVSRYNQTDMGLEPGAPMSYINFVGFVTCLSLMVSVYTLMFASFDRYNAISSPLSYSRDTSVRRAKQLIVVVWIISAVVSILPIWTPNVRPYLPIVGGLIIGVTPEVGAILYAVTLALPLLLVWILSIATMCVARRQARLRSSMVSRQATGKASVESRLNKTLWIMVTAFTLSVLPAALLSMLSGVGQISFNYPETLDKDAAYVFTGLEVVAAMLLMCNSLWNCFIYSLRNKDFRAEVLSKYSKVFSAFRYMVVCSCCGSVARDGRRRLSSAFTSFRPRQRNRTISENVTQLTSVGTTKGPRNT